MNNDTPKPTPLNRCFLLHVLFMQAGIPTPRADAYDAYEITRLDAINDATYEGPSNDAA